MSQNMAGNLHKIYFWSACGVILDLCNRCNPQHPFSGFIGQASSYALAVSMHKCLQFVVLCPDLTLHVAVYTPFFLHFGIKN